MKFHLKTALLDNGTYGFIAEDHRTSSLYHLQNSQPKKTLHIYYYNKSADDPRIFVSERAVLEELHSRISHGSI